MITRTAGFVALLLFLGNVGVAEAQTEAQLQRVLERLAAAWAEGDAAAVVQLAVRAGLTLDLTGQAVGPLAPRQATAVLRNMLEQRETVEIETSGRILGGAPQRASGELNWLSRARGTTIAERSTVFLEMVHEEDGWRVTQIRLLQ